MPQQRFAKRDPRAWGRSFVMGVQEPYKPRRSKQTKQERDEEEKKQRLWMEAMRKRDQVIRREDYKFEELQTKRKLPPLPDPDNLGNYNVDARSVAYIANQEDGEVFYTGGSFSDDDFNSDSDSDSDFGRGPGRGGGSNKIVRSGVVRQLFPKTPVSSARRGAANKKNNNQKKGGANNMMNGKSGKLLSPCGWDEDSESGVMPSSSSSRLSMKSSSSSSTSSSSTSSSSMSPPGFSSNSAGTLSWKTWKAPPKGSKLQLPPRDSKKPEDFCCAEEYFQFLQAHNTVDQRNRRARNKKSGKPDQTRKKAEKKDQNRWQADCRRRKEAAKEKSEKEEKEAKSNKKKETTSNKTKGAKSDKKKEVKKDTKKKK